MTMINDLSDIPAVASYLYRINARVRSLRTAVIEEKDGQYWNDIEVIKISETGEVTCKDEYQPTEAEAQAIREGCAAAEWPRHKLLKRLVDVPEAIKNADPKNVFEFRNKDNEIIMLQLKRVVKGEKSYKSFTYWSDGRWRDIEPEPHLPLWGLNNIKDNSTVFIHEGAAAARYVSWMVAGETKDARDALAACPWGEDLKGAAHVGWIGGAKNPGRTEWSQLKKLGITRAYIVSDNDDPGLKAVPAIAEKLRMTTFQVQFTNDWKSGFDLADEWPQKMFSEIEGHKYYTGPSFRSCLQPATWATDIVPNPRGRPTTVLRENFKQLWAYIEDVDLFVCTEMPDLLRTESVLNKMLRPFSNSNETTRLIVQAYTGRTTKLCYRPDNKGRMIINRGSTSINLHIATDQRPAEGSPEPFLEFMAYMFPNEPERIEMLRWCATLIAHPEVRMEYGVLLVSEIQGVGKTTLGSAILAPLVGPDNVSFPGENDITNSDFNGWLAHKRLAIINEIYSGHSWKAYNRLKNYITDQEISVNQKYMRSYTAENWCHIFACSNSLRALKMEDDDRRWFYPEVTEKRWPKERFIKLRRWLSGGGLGIILRWAQEQPDWVVPGERAPMTVRKRELIEGSRTDAQKEAADLAVTLIKIKDPIALGMKDVEQYVKMAVKGRVFDTDYDLRKAMKEAGANVMKKRLLIEKRLQYVMVNDALKEKIEQCDPQEWQTLVQGAVRKPNDILPLGM